MAAGHRQGDDLHLYDHASPPPAPFKKVPPYIVATVELEEGVRVISNVINCAVDQIRTGMPVRVAWVQITDEFRFPLFEPDR